MAALGEVNLLVVLARPNRVPHAPAGRWFARRAPLGSAARSLVAKGFVRISAEIRAMAAILLSCCTSAIAFR